MSLYVGGLSESTNERMLRAAFIPFGPIKCVDLPINYIENKSRGFGFVTYEDDEDAVEAKYNMDGSELMGRVLTVDTAQENQIKFDSRKAVWSTDDWFLEKQKKDDEIKKDKEKQI